MYSGSISTNLRSNCGYSALTHTNTSSFILMRCHQNNHFHISPQIELSNLLYFLRKFCRLHCLYRALWFSFFFFSFRFTVCFRKKVISKWNWYRAHDHDHEHEPNTLVRRSHHANAYLQFETITHSNSNRNQSNIRLNIFFEYYGCQQKAHRFGFPFERWKIR